MLQVKNIESIISYGDIELPNIPGMTAQQMLKHYAQQYSDLITSKLTGPVIDANGRAIYTASKEKLSSLG